MIDPRLRTLRTFAECGTVAATAELTGYSPSAISAQLRELQRALGMTLLTKDGRGLRLTATGRHIVQQSNSLVAEWERIKADALTEGNQTQGTFGLGGFSTAASNLLVPLAAKLRRTHPNVQVHLSEANPARCFELLVAERLDLAVVISMQSDTHEDDTRFEQITLLDDPLDVMMPATHRFAGRESISLAELAGEEWFTDAPGSPYHALFTAAFTAAGYTPRLAHEAVEWETGMAMVGAGIGIGLIPRLVSLDRNEHVVRVRIAGAGRPMRRIVAAVRRGSLTSPLIRASLTTLRQIATEILEQRREEEM